LPESGTLIASLHIPAAKTDPAGLVMGGFVPFLKYIFLFNQKNYENNDENFTFDKKFYHC
jgi:hypothetical protein